MIWSNIYGRYLKPIQTRGDKLPRGGVPGAAHLRHEAGGPRGHPRPHGVRGAAHDAGRGDQAVRVHVSARQGLHRRAAAGENDRYPGHDRGSFERIR